MHRLRAFNRYTRQINFSSSGALCGNKNSFDSCLKKDKNNRKRVLSSAIFIVTWCLPPAVGLSTNHEKYFVECCAFSKFFLRDSPSILPLICFRLIVEVNGACSAKLRAHVIETTYFPCFALPTAALSAQIKPNLLLHRVTLTIYPSTDVKY